MISRDVRDSRPFCCHSSDRFIAIRFISILPRNRATIFRLREPLTIMPNIKVRLVNYTILY